MSSDDQESSSESKELTPYNVESKSDYRIGGYYPAQVNETLQNRFILRRKMGYGSYSTVWLARDKLLNKLCVLKLIKSGISSTESGMDEIKMNRHINFYRIGNEASEKVMRMLDDFKLSGVYGLHISIVYEPLGFTLSQLIDDQSYLPLQITKSISKQLLQGLDYLHSICQIIHADIKPLNILVVVSEDYLKNMEEEVIELQKNNLPLPNFMTSNVGKTLKSKSSMIPHLGYGDHNLNNLKIKIGDFGNSCIVCSPRHDLIQTLPYRSPEVILRSGYGTGVDIWSTACTIFELLTGEHLFYLKCGPNYTYEEYHLASIIALTGKPSLRIMSNSRLKHLYFNKDKSLIKFPNIKPVTLPELLVASGVTLQEEETAKFTSFLRPMLSTDVARRPRAIQCLQHPWLDI